MDSPLHNRLTQRSVLERNIGKKNIYIMSKKLKISNKMPLFILQVTQSTFKPHYNCSRQKKKVIK
jgi:hypothetical protein